jgi:hypothetical protein
MKSLLTLVVVVLVAGMALGLFRHSKARDLRERNEGLRGILTELQSLRADNDRLRGYSADHEELKRMRSEQNELLRLRAGVTALRGSANATIPELQQRIQQTLAEAGSAAKMTELLQAREQAAEQREETHGMLSQILMLLHITSRETGGPLPGSFQQLEMTLSRLPADSRIRVRGPGMLNHTNRFGLSVRDFEFLPQTRPIRAEDEDASVLLLRERTPRPHPDGGWVRAYGFANSKTEEAFSEDGNFAEWERNASKGVGQ